MEGSQATGCFPDEPRHGQAVAPCNSAEPQSGFFRFLEFSSSALLENSGEVCLQVKKTLSLRVDLKSVS